MIIPDVVTTCNEATSSAAVCSCFPCTRSSRFFGSSGSTPGRRASALRGVLKLGGFEPLALRDVISEGDQTIINLFNRARHVRGGDVPTHVLDLPHSAITYDLHAVASFKHDFLLTRRNRNAREIRRLRLVKVLASPSTEGAAPVSHAAFLLHLGRFYTRRGRARVTLHNDPKAEG